MSNNSKIDDYQNARAVPEGISLIEVRMSNCTFRRKLQYKDIGLDKDVESKLLSLGSKGVLGPEWAKKFRNIVEGTKRELGMIGVSYGNNIYAIPTVRYEDAFSLVKGKELQFAELKKYLLSRYEIEVETYADEAEELQEGFGQIVRNSAFPLEYIEKQLTYEVVGASELENVVANKSVDQVGDLANDYYQRLVKTAKDKHKAIEITPNTRKVLTKIHDFVKGMMFLDERLTIAHQYLKAFIQKLPLHAKDATSELNRELVQLLINLQNIDGLNAMADTDKCGTIAYGTVMQSSSEEEEMWFLGSGTNNQLSGNDGNNDIETEEDMLSYSDNTQEYDDDDGAFVW